MMRLRLAWVIALLLLVAAFAFMVWVVDTLQHSYAPRPYPDRPVTDIRPLAEFREFPVYWLGFEYAGLPLTNIRRSRADNIVIVGYGYCTTSGGLLDSGCRLPIEIDQRRPCDWFKYTNTPTADPNGYFGWGDGVGVEVGRTGDAATAVASDHQIIINLKVVNTAYFPSTPLTNSTMLRDAISAQCAATPGPTALSQ